MKPVVSIIIDIDTIKENSSIQYRFGTTTNRKEEEMFTLKSMYKFMGLLLVASSLLIQPASASENAKWFVLRHDNPESCWVGLLISIDGSYRHAFAQKAGGPYDTKA